MSSSVEASLKNVRVHALADRERRLERLVAVIALLVPTLGAALALVLARLWGVGWTEVSMLIVGHALTAMGITIGYHRFASHRAFEAQRWVQALFVVLGSMSLQGPVLWWAAIHRRHHATSDRPGDPHSPYIQGTKKVGGLRGFWHAHIGWLFVHESTDWMFYVPELLKDRFLFALNRYYFAWVALGLAIPAAIGGAVHGTWQGAVLGFLWGGLFRIFTVQQATWCINSVCHVFGTRPFECRDAARNNVIVVVLTMGEGWHNHHHTFPKTAINQFEWWQIDPSGLVLRALEAVGSVCNLHFPSREARELYRRELLTRARANEGQSA